MFMHGARQPGFHRLTGHKHAHEVSVYMLCMQALYICIVRRALHSTCKVQQHVSKVAVVQCAVPADNRDRKALYLNCNKAICCQ